MLIRKKCLILALLLLPMLARSQVEGMPTVDFQRYFPHLFAVSDLQKNEQYPDGVQYKFLTVRDEQEQTVIIALVRRTGKETVKRLLLAKGPIGTSEVAINKAVQSFSAREKVTFEIIDLRDVRTMDAFSKKSTALGWDSESFAQP